MRVPESDGDELDQGKKPDLAFQAVQDEPELATGCFQGSKDETSRTVNFCLLVKAFPLIALFPSVPPPPACRRCWPTAGSSSRSGRCWSPPA